ncbi:MAG: hypothetical protein HY652_01060, partial [Acidobacteria bacterium]|nr:hypothetical protein [Acidobacteriota bacterium]
MSESFQVLPGASVRGQLLSRRLRNVRHRLRWEKALRGMAWTVGGFLLLSVVTTWLASVANFSSQRVQIFAWSLALGTAAIFFWSLLRPQFQKLDDGKLARFVEEKNPHIQDRLVTAVEVSSKKGSFPEPLLRRLVEDAWSRTAAVTNRQLFEVRETLISTVALALAVLLLAVGLLWGPAFLTHGFQQFWSAWSAADLPSPLYQIEIRPGNVTVARNSDQEVLARPLGFQPSGVRLFARSGKGETWEEFPMEAIPRQQGFRFLLFDLRAPVRYYAEADGIRSGQFLIDISELPKVRRIQLTYHFPSYTGLPPRVEEDGGDIRALAGTRVLARILTDVPLTQGSLQLEDGSRIPLKPVPGENQLAGELVVRSDSLYHVRLVDSSGKDVKASDDYLIVALDDQPPAVRISQPGRDEQVTSVEEVLAEAEAQDDFGLAELRLHYSVNGAPEQGKLLAKNPGREARGHHIFYLEEFGLVPGDLVTYYASARDGRSSAQTDVYFLEIRAFEKEFYQGQTRPAGGQMGSQADDLFLSERQKEIIAATWNLIRRQAEIEPASFAQNAGAVATAQRKLRERLETLIARLQSSHLVGAGAEVRTLLEEMEQASKAMEAARSELSARRLRDAMIPEQKALQHLLRAEASFRKIQVNFGNQGMAGGESSRSWAKDLQDLFELELDREKNQYETLPQASQRGEEMDEAMQRLKELARRQEQLLDQQRNASGQPPATSRWEQETLRRETEELARRLERMAGRQGQGDPSTLEDIRRRLERAARDMEAANRPGSGSSQEATRALERLREAQSALSRQRGQRHQGQIEDLANRAEELVQDQKR